MTSLNLLGQTIGGFEILNELGRGGMAVVYRARQHAPSRLVALKVLPPELSLDASYIARFRQEADSAAALEHPHIVPIYALGDADGLHYIAMKLIVGRTLRELIDAEGPLTVEQAAALLGQIADALDYAHRSGVIHRDIKPSNVIIDQGGWLYLTDFGLARGMLSGGLTMTGAVMGTPEYMSPEQAEGRANIGATSDIYALGVVLYELLTGHMPFEAETPLGVLVARLQQPPRSPRLLRPDLDPQIEAVMLKALARKPEDRFASAHDLVDALRVANQASSTQAMKLPVTTYAPPHAPQPTPPIIPAANVGPTIALQTPVPPVMSAAPQPLVAAKPRRSWRTCLVGCLVIGVLSIGFGGWSLYALYDYGNQLTLVEGTRDLSLQANGVVGAIDTLRQLTADHPRLSEAKATLGLMYALRGRYSQAQQAAEQAIAINDSGALAHAVLAEALNDRGERSRALSEAERAITLDGKLSYAQTVRASIRADLAVEHNDGTLLQAASANASDALTSAADEDQLAIAMAHSSLAYIHWQEHQFKANDASLSQGIKEINLALQSQPKLAQLHTTLGYFYDAQKKPEQARQSFERALALDAEYAPAQAGLGWNRYGQGDNRGAITAFDAALTLDANLMNAYLGKNFALQALDPADYPSAITVLQKAVAIAPQSARLLTDLGWAYRGQALRYEYASAAQKAGYAAAEAQFRAALQLDDRMFEARTGLGWALQDSGVLANDKPMIQHSVELLKQSLDAKEDQPFAQNALGWSLYQLGQYDQSLAAFDRAIALQATYADAQFGRGRVFEAQGNRTEARTAYTTAAQQGSEPAKAALDTLK